MRKGFTILIFVMLSSSLFAASALKIGYISEFEEKGFEVLFQDALNLVFSHCINEDNIFEIYKLRQGVSMRKKADLEYHKALSNDNFDTTRIVDFTYEKPDSFEVIKPENPDFFDFSAPDESSLHLLKIEELDILFVLEGGFDDFLLDYKISFYTLSGGKPVINRLMLMNKAEEEFYPLIKLLLSFFSKSYSIIELDIPTSVSSISVDSKPGLLINNHLIINPGFHSINLTFLGGSKQTFELEIGNGEKQTLKVDKVDPDLNTLSLFMIPHNADIMLNGKNYDSSSLYEMEVEYPISILAKAEGFHDLSYQQNTVSSQLRLELKPEWMGDGKLITQSKKDVYKALRNTLLAFGLYVAAVSLDNVYQGTFSSHIQPFKLTFASISIISLIDFIYKTSGYYHTAEQLYY